MQIGTKTSEQIQAAAKKLAGINEIEVLYFADSLGNMEQEDVTRTIQDLKSHWKKSIGIHTHNNQGKAVANTLKALSDGATWLDSTVLGLSLIHI